VNCGGQRPAGPSSKVRNGPEELKGPSRRSSRFPKDSVCGGPLARQQPDRRQRGGKLVPFQTNKAPRACSWVQALSSIAATNTDRWWNTCGMNGITRRPAKADNPRGPQRHTKEQVLHVFLWGPPAGDTRISSGSRPLVGVGASLRRFRAVRNSPVPSLRHMFAARGNSPTLGRV